QESANKLNTIKQKGGKIISVGTTSTRVLETVMRDNNGAFKEKSGWTDIYIYPPYEYKSIDGLITNFHLHKSSLLLIVNALAGRDTILAAYEEAIERKYRFFSFGDAMFILPKKDEA